MSIARLSFVTGTIGWAALLPLAPFAVSQPAPARWWYALAFLAYGAGSVVCHQLPARSFHLWAVPLPVCARCTGIYVGAAVIVLWLMARLRSDPTGSSDARRLRALLATAVVPTLFSLLYEWTTGDVPSNMVRALTGAPLGAAAAFVVMSGVR